MRHKNGLRKLGRNTSHRAAMLRNMVSSLFLTPPAEDGTAYERIITTREKAKEARRLAEKAITLGKKGTLAARRRAVQLLGNRVAVRKLFDTIAPRYQTRPGGYTRIIGYPSNRLGDNAQQVIFELIEPYGEEAAAQPVRPAVTAQATEPQAGQPETTQKQETQQEHQPETQEDQTEEENEAESEK